MVVMSSLSSLSLMQLEGETGEDEERESRLFPDPDQADLHISDHALTPDFLIYATDVSNVFS